MPKNLRHKRKANSRNKNIKQINCQSSVLNKFSKCSIERLSFLLLGILIWHRNPNTKIEEIVKANSIILDIYIDLLEIHVDRNINWKYINLNTENLSTTFSLNEYINLSKINNFIDRVETTQPYSDRH